MKNFWEKLKAPVIGLAPMDGVTEAAFRYITAKYGQPSLIYTEFVAAEGLIKARERLEEDLIFSPKERPIVAQIFGSQPESFYQAVKIIAELGFDGVDINLGCPDRAVVNKQKAGAALIKQPKLAKEIVKQTKKGIQDWVKEKDKRETIPVSVKTRIGVDKKVTEEWISQLLEAQPAAIAIHGRTLSQGYAGQADWEEIGKAVKLAKGTKTKIVGNGDVNSYREAEEKIGRYKVDGVLIGRASLGNPWVFRKDYQPTREEKLKVMLEQAEIFTKTFKRKKFINMRKHLGWFCKGFPGAKELREKLVRTDSYEEVKEIVVKYL